jgi:hypothetical protein
MQCCFACWSCRRPMGAGKVRPGTRAGVGRPASNRLSSRVAMNDGRMGDTAEGVGGERGVTLASVALPSHSLRRRLTRHVRVISHTSRLVTRQVCKLGNRLFLAAGAPGSTALSEAPINCGVGCARDRPLLVCGADNVTYAHRCLAICQGVSVQARGACATEDADLLDTSGDLPSVTIDVMTRFRSRGFKYVQDCTHRCAYVCHCGKLCGMINMPCYTTTTRLQLRGQRQGGPFQLAH